MPGVIRRVEAAAGGCIGTGRLLVGPPAISHQDATGLIRAIASSAPRMLVTDDLEESMARVAAEAVAVVPSACCASVTLVEHRAFRTVAATDERASAIDDAQYASREGPCLLAIAEEPVVTSTDVAADERWPRLAEQLGEGACRAVVSCRLTVDDGAGARPIGSLNVYCGRPGVLGADDIDAAVLLGAFGAVVLHGARQTANLVEALRSRDVIGQAKGILMEREHLTDDQAFDRLRTASQRRNRKLRALAEQLVLTGQLEPTTED